MSINKSQTNKFQKQKIDLSKARIIKKNLVYLIGLPQEIAKQQILIKKEYLGQYGKINKIIINKPVFLGQNKNQFSVYVTFQSEKDAMLCRMALEEYKFQNNLIKANFGTTKYCSYFISKKNCQNQECLYLHQSAMQSEIYLLDQVQQGIKDLQQEQYDYFLKNFQKFSDDKKQNKENNEFPTIQSIFDKYQKKVQIENKQVSEFQQKQLDIYKILGFDCMIDIKDDMNRKIAKQFLIKSEKNYQSRYSFAIDNDSTENSSIEQDPMKQLLQQIIEKTDNQNNRGVTLLTGNGKLSKSLNKQTHFQQL